MDSHVLGQVRLDDISELQYDNDHPSPCPWTSCHKRCMDARSSPCACPGTASRLCSSQTPSHTLGKHTWHIDLLHSIMKQEDWGSAICYISSSFWHSCSDLSKHIKWRSSLNFSRELLNWILSFQIHLDWPWWTTAMWSFNKNIKLFYLKHWQIELFWVETLRWEEFCTDTVHPGSGQWCRELSSWTFFRW